MRLSVAESGNAAASIANMCFILTFHREATETVWKIYHYLMCNILAPHLSGWRRRILHVILNTTLTLVFRLTLLQFNLSMVWITVFWVFFGQTEIRSHNLSAKSTRELLKRGTFWPNFVGSWQMATFKVLKNTDRLFFMSGWLEYYWPSLWKFVETNQISNNELAQFQFSSHGLRMTKINEVHWSLAVLLCCWQLSTRAP